MREVAVQLVKGIKYLHTKVNKSHGGICPSQILIDRDSSVKVPT